MQNVAPEIMDLERESQATRDIYGIDDEHTDEFGRTLLLARRFSEAGVRYVTTTHSSSRLRQPLGPARRPRKGAPRQCQCGRTNRLQPSLRDLEARGLLEDTLVLCGSEFGRTPSRELFDGQMGRSDDGRDHNPHGFTMWMCGGGNQARLPPRRHRRLRLLRHQGPPSPSTTSTPPSSHLMGIDHKHLTFHHSGRDYRLTDVSGEVVRKILA